MIRLLLSVVFLAALALGVVITAWLECSSWVVLLCPASRSG